MASSRGVYRGIFSTLPDDPDFQRLTPQARLTLYTLRLCRQAGIGVIFRFYATMLAEQTGLSPKALERALAELIRGGWIEREGVVVWVRNGLRYDPNVRLSDPKHRKAIISHLAELPKLEIVLRFCDYYQITRPFDDPSRTKVESGTRNHSRRQEQEQEQEQETTTPLPPSPRGAEAEAEVAWGKPEDLVALYNSQAPDNVPAVEELSPKRRDKALRALRTYPTETWWREVFAQYRRSRFLRGLTKPANGHASFRPDFDWLLSVGKNGVENYVKVHDGMYAD